MSRELIVSQPPASAMEAHELVNEAEEALRSSQKIIKAALRGLGAASDISEAGDPLWEALRPPFHLREQSLQEWPPLGWEVTWPVWCVG